MSTIKILLIFCIYFLTTTLLSAQITKIEEKKDTDKTWYSNEIELPNNINWYTNTIKELEINGCEFEFVESTELNKSSLITSESRYIFNPGSCAKFLN